MLETPGENIMSLQHIFEPDSVISSLLAPLQTDRMASAEYFKVMIQRERALADRNGRMLALLVFNVGTAPAQDVHKLVAILKKRIRETDDIGWLDPDGIGVLLRQTSYDGAQNLAHHLNRSLEAGHLVFNWHILSYPEPNPEKAISGTPIPDPRMMSLLAKPIPKWKRLTDIVISASTLILLSPLLLLISLGIKIVAPGPVLFRQERVGYLGRRFMCLKFRSMKAQASSDIHRAHLQQLIQSNAPMKKLDEAKDNRIIPMGRFMRACALDELPQLINVLRGDMSLVGPRPCLAYEFETFLRWHKRRFDTLPGLTGLWQVSGKNKTSFGEMMRLDVAYEHHRSFLFDLMIIGKTPMVLAEQMMETITLPVKEHTYESAH